MERMNIHSAQLMNAHVRKEAPMQRTAVMLALTLSAGIVVGMIEIHVLNAQHTAATRTELLKTDLVGIEGKEAVILTVEGGPGLVGGKHYHPGSEFAYVLEGLLVLEVEGKPPATFKAGDTFYIPPKVVHRGNNASTTAPYKVLVFGVFEKGQPDTTPVQ
jgi:quercetin dioxygenase-like cupin family protein